MGRMSETNFKEHILLFIGIATGERVPNSYYIFERGVRGTQARRS